MTEVLGGNSQQQLRSIIERAERLEEEKAAVATDLRELFAEAKGNGFEPKIIRRVLRLRKMDEAKRQEELAMTEMYLTAIGMLD